LDIAGLSNADGCLNMIGCVNEFCMTCRYNCDIPKTFLRTQLALECNQLHCVTDVNFLQNCMFYKETHLHLGTFFKAVPMFSSVHM